jgi:NAD(P)H-dependent FMN reductase
VVNFARLTKDVFDVTIFNDLKSLPHFDPELSIENTPQMVTDFRKQIEMSDGVLICTPEYIFSLPSGLKNAIERCVSTTVFTDKPLGLITASAHGEKTHEELQRIMKTLMAKFNPDACMLVRGVKSKFNNEGMIIDSQLMLDLELFVQHFRLLLV